MAALLVAACSDLNGPATIPAGATTFPLELQIDFTWFEFPPP